mmetsp:Transcript_37217/g.97466  ORF Transcript_37217/g.97466 Transcript_37217/m.97466 type:complete len:330 (+) Transcript_37217:1191-2180(+)
MMYSITSRRGSRAPYPGLQLPERYDGAAKEADRSRGRKRRFRVRGKMTTPALMSPTIVKRCHRRPSNARRRSKFLSRVSRRMPAHTSSTTSSLQSRCRDRRRRDRSYLLKVRRVTRGISRLIPRRPTRSRYLMVSDPPAPQEPRPEFRLQGKAMRKPTTRDSIPSTTGVLCRGHPLQRADRRSRTHVPFRRKQERHMPPRSSQCSPSLSPLPEERHRSSRAAQATRIRLFITRSSKRRRVGNVHWIDTPPNLQRSSLAGSIIFMTRVPRRGISAGSGVAAVTDGDMRVVQFSGVESGPFRRSLSLFPRSAGFPPGRNRFRFCPPMVTCG